MLAASLIAVAAIVLGVRATSYPVVPPKDDADRVIILATIPDVTVRLSWKVSASGSIEWEVFAQSPSTEAFDVYLVLACDARFEIRSYVDEPTVAGSPNECPSGGGDDSIDDLGYGYDYEPAKIATQTIVIPFSDGTGRAGHGALGQRHVVPWTRASGGWRETLTPGFSFRAVDLASEVTPDPPLEISDQSSVTVSLEASGTEALDSFAPEELTEGTVELSRGDPDLLSGHAESVVWTTSAGPLDGVSARWLDSVGLSTAQLGLLMSGALLGVSASLFVELLFGRATGVGGTGVRGRAAATSRRRIAGERTRALRPPRVHRLTIPLAWTGAALLAAGGVAILVVSAILVSRFDEGASMTQGLEIYVAVQMIPPVAFAAVALHYLTRPERNRIVGVAFFALIGLSRVVVSAAPRVSAYAATGALLVAAGGWLAFAGRGGSSFARSMRTPSVVVMAAGVSILIGAWDLTYRVGEMGVVFLFLVWPVALVAMAVVYAMSAVRLGRERTLQGMQRGSNRGSVDWSRHMH